MRRPTNQQLKAALRKRFPATSWRVFAGRGTARCWTTVAWTDGPSVSLVEDFLATMDMAPGSMDMTDMWVGARVSTERKISDAFMDRVAAALVGAANVPARDTWGKAIERGNGGGWYTFDSCVRLAIARRDEYDYDRARFDANAWMDAVAAGVPYAANSTTYRQ